MPQTEKQRQWYLKNKERLAEMNKQNYQKNKEERKEKQRLYYLENKDKIGEYQKEYNAKNKEKVATRTKAYQKEYYQTPAGKKSYRISNWKKRGVISDDFDELYEKYLTTHFCELCNCSLTEDTIATSTTRCLDHCHDTGLFRNVLCMNCNLNVVG
tara:strand:+ start:59 stop:526 length:468 start_codon:yes stop_codon:yes gene_type:complete